MKKASVVIGMIIIAAALVAATGCGARYKIVNLDKMLMNGESWNYEGDDGDLVVFGEDGSFRWVNGEKVENGGYEADGDQLELTFVDSKGNEVRTEDWNIDGDIGGEDAVITDSEGQEYALTGTRETLR